VKIWIKKNYFCYFWALIFRKNFCPFSPSNIVTTTKIAQTSLLRSHIIWNWYSFPGCPVGNWPMKSVIIDSRFCAVCTVEHCTFIHYHVYVALQPTSLVANWWSTSSWSSRIMKAGLPTVILCVFTIFIQVECSDQIIEMKKLRCPFGTNTVRLVLF
jgi:hypothetical protein